MKKLSLLLQQCSEWKKYKLTTCLALRVHGAHIEAKESMEGKRKLNTLDNLLNELRKDSKP